MGENENQTRETQKIKNNHEESTKNELRILKLSTALYEIEETDVSAVSAQPKQKWASSVAKIPLIKIIECKVVNFKIFDNNSSQVKHICCVCHVGD